MVSRPTSLLLAALTLAGGPALAAPPNLVGSGDFDFYVLTLSWSPGFCDTQGQSRAGAQCEAGSGAGFVVHGLWPNRAFGQDPESCTQGAYVPGSALRRADGLYPDEGLARYEYRKHGTCSGLDAEHYFEAVRYARDQVALPDALLAPRAELTMSPRALRDAFLEVNPDLGADAVAVSCSRGELTDVRFCLSKDLDSYVACPRVVSHGCRESSITISPPR